MEVWPLLGLGDETWKGRGARSWHREQVVFALEMPSLFHNVVINSYGIRYERKGISGKQNCLLSWDEMLMWSQCYRQYRKRWNLRAVRCTITEVLP
jgi:hypothetical protein